MISALLQFIVLYTTLGNRVLHTVALDLGSILWVLGASILSMALVRAFNIVVGKRLQQP